MFKKQINKKINKKQKGFVILIAVLVSMILLSIGIFIASVATREIQLSSSAKGSQAAFFAADSVLECALFKEFKRGGFRGGPTANGTTWYTEKISAEAYLECNEKRFTWEVSKAVTLIDKNNISYDAAKHVYYISFADNLSDGGDDVINQSDITGDESTKFKPYVKLVVYIADSASDPSKVQVFGHNIREGANIVERAIEVVW